jgi:hypothetical protein
MTKANGQYLITQFKTYYAVMQVPKDLHVTLGKKKFIQTLETHNFAEAEIRKLPHIHRWKSLIKAARAKERGEIVDLEATVEESRKLFEELGGGESAFETVAHT